jgi:hypothetical protein
MGNVFRTRGHTLLVNTRRLLQRRTTILFSVAFFIARSVFNVTMFPWRQPNGMGNRILYSKPRATGPINFRDDVFKRRLKRHTSPATGSNSGDAVCLVLYASRMMRKSHHPGAWAECGLSADP